MPPWALTQPAQAIAPGTAGALDCEFGPVCWTMTPISIADPVGPVAVGEEPLADVLPLVVVLVLPPLLLHAATSSETAISPRPTTRFTWLLRSSHHPLRPGQPLSDDWIQDNWIQDTEIRTESNAGKGPIS